MVPSPNVSSRPRSITPTRAAYASCDVRPASRAVAGVVDQRAVREVADDAEGEASVSLDGDRVEHEPAAAALGGLKVIRCIAPLHLGARRGRHGEPRGAGNEGQESTPAS